MIYLYIVLGIVFLMVMLLLFVPVRMHIEYLSKHLQLELRVIKLKFDLTHFVDKPQKSKHKKTQQQQSAETDEQLTLIQKINKVYKKADYLKKVYTDSSKNVNRGIITENIEADINFGFSDAAVTGMVTGLIWSLLYEILGLVSIVTRVKNHKFNVDAVYDRFVFEPRFSVTLKTRISDVIRILISILYNLKKYKE